MAAEGAWIRDSRRETYDRFLTKGQQLLIACQDETEQTIEAADVDFFGAYGVVQTVADIRVVEAARVYAYRLQELEAIALGKNKKWGPVAKDLVAQHVRTARHGAIDAMRRDLGLTGRVAPPKTFNPFQGTDFSARYAARHGIPAADVASEREEHTPSA